MKRTKGLIMRQITNRKFYTYKQAAERVQRNPQTIRKWRMAGMPMTWNQRGERVVAHGILLAELRRRNDDDCRSHTPAARAVREAFEADMRAWLGGDDESDPGIPCNPSTQATTATRVSGEYTSHHTRPRRTLAASAPEPAPTTAWDRLRAALATTVPDCADDGRFTLDTLVPGEAEYLAKVCAVCPLLEACAAYAREVKPEGGFWPTPENMGALAAGRAA